MTTNKMTPIRYFSVMNPWIDFLVFVPSKYTDIATRKITEAMDAFWEDEHQFECFGDAVTEELEHFGVPFTMVTMPWDYKADAPKIPELVWEEWISSMPECITLN